MAQAIRDDHPYYDIYVCERNLRFWKVVMQGPVGSIYSAGAFSTTLEMDSTFPDTPPKARFITPILHPNITRQGEFVIAFWIVCCTAFQANLQAIGSLRRPS